MKHSNRKQDPPSVPRPGKGNQLKNCNSPYLLQHADQPVDWFPWCDKAFDAAHRWDKPVFLSIGYAACHWCHVMARESFSDPEVARLLNDSFVCIKVDREERPEIDRLYMRVCQYLTGSGGWPLTVVMTPDRKPFFAATYLPRESRGGQPGMLDLVPRISRAWSDRRAEVQQSAEKMTNALQTGQHLQAGEPPNSRMLLQARDTLAAHYDAVYGGFGTAPKFPAAPQLIFLLRAGYRSGDSRTTAMVTHTLRCMARSGMFDQVGHGFHRYATDREWKVPHFEKMLYDQALLLAACTEAWQATEDHRLARTARHLVEYVRRDLQAPEGAFYSSENAESEGREGKFYVWRRDEIHEALDRDDADLAVLAYDIEAEGNFTAAYGDDLPGANVLHRSESIEDLARRLGSSPSEVEQRLDSLNHRLRTYRDQRVRPELDDKILTDWNGLMIAALAKAGSALDEPDWITAAETAAGFLRENLRDSRGRLLHRYRKGRAGVAACADDYAFLVWGLLELYEAAFNLDYLEAAADIQNSMINHFWDARQGGFFYTSDDTGGSLPVRDRDLHDGALPSANAVALLNLLRLARMTDVPEYENKAEALMRAFAGSVRKAPAAYTMFLCGVDFAIGPSFEVVLAEGADKNDWKAMVSRLRSVYAPRKVVLKRPPGPRPPITLWAPFAAEQTALDGMTTAYVCRGRACSAPVTDTEEMLELLRDQGPEASL